MSNRNCLRIRFCPSQLRSDSNPKSLNFARVKLFGVPKSAMGAMIWNGVGGVLCLLPDLIPIF